MLGGSTGHAGSAGTLSQSDQGLSPCQTTPGDTTGDVTSYLENTAGITREQGQRPRGQCPSSSSYDKPNLGLVGVFSPARGKGNKKIPVISGLLNNPAII